YKAFVECFQRRLVPAGYLGIISSRTGFFLGQSEDWRTRVVLRLFRPVVLADLGVGVLDAMVEVAAYVLRSLSAPEARDLTRSIVPVLGKVLRDSQDRFSLPKWQAARGGLKRHQAVAELEHLEANGFVQRSSGDTVRYTPCWSLVKKCTAAPETVFPTLVCVRALAEIDKGATLLASLSDSSHSKKYACNPGRFSAIPGTRFAYWATARIRQMFSRLPTVEQDERNVRIGDHPSDDFRWLRLFWEPTTSQTTADWRPYQKGGSFSRYYADIHLVVNWDAARTTYRGFIGRIGRSSERPSNYEFYFQPGITWPRRSQKGASFRVLPAGCAFSDKGPSVSFKNHKSKEILAVLALLNSEPFRGLIALQVAFGSYEVGAIQQTVIPILDSSSGQRVAFRARAAWEAKRTADIVVEASHAFILPAILTGAGSTLAERIAAWAASVRGNEETVAAIQAEIDEIASCLYGLDAADRAALTSTLRIEATVEAESDEEEDTEAHTSNVPALTAELLTYAFGVSIGRWDIRYATGEQAEPELPEPFAPLPPCPPGQLQNSYGLPASPEDVPDSYPIAIPWDGILVDDPNDPLDIERRVRHVFEIIWTGKDGGPTVEAIEHEACEILGVKSLRDYFRKPANFFADHLKRYSKSRRQAPIYWPLSTASGNYTLWVYYHRLTDQTLFIAVNDFVEPKLKQVVDDLRSLRAKSGSSTQEEKELESLTSLETELIDFRDELLRIAKFWKPNLNDGVQITAAPLWRFFKLAKWQKTLKETWEKLDAGDYDWAHLALSIWPQRVVRTAYRDRSIAIAHDLEDQLWHEVEISKTSKTGKVTKKKEWQPKPLAESQLDAIAAEVSKSR
ncbi:MAG TPA: hypothetical protein DDZ51_00285, partial [Planctomycetaceae bacterium]|nr:hypothetical protein [Planctomycetaceae bacterium]